MQNQIPIVDINGNIPILNTSSERMLRGVLFISNRSFVFDMSGYSCATITFSNGQGNPRVLVSTSNDGINYGETQITPTIDIPSGQPARGTTFNGTSTFSLNRAGRFVKIDDQNTITPTSVTVSLHNGSGLSKKPDLRLQSKYAFYYTAPSGGIVSTTPITISPAISASFFNGVTSIDLRNAGTAGTEFLISSSQIDGGGAGVIWRTYIAPGDSISQSFIPFVRGAAGGTLSISIVSATNVILYANVRGMSTQSHF